MTTLLRDTGQTAATASLALLSRVGLSLLFIISGWGKIAGYAATQQYMEAMGVPGALLPWVIALELGGGLALLAGAFTRPIALAMAGFSLLAAALFHADLADANQAVAFWKNVAMAGGFLMLVAHGAGAFSVDALAGRRRALTGGAVAAS